MLVSAPAARFGPRAYLSRPRSDGRLDASTFAFEPPQSNANTQGVSATTTGQIHRQTAQSWAYTGTSRGGMPVTLPYSSLPGGDLSNASVGRNCSHGASGALLWQLEAEVLRAGELLDQLGKVHTNQSGLLQQYLREEMPSRGILSATLSGASQSGRFKGDSTDHVSEKLKDLSEVGDDDNDSENSDVEHSQESYSLLHNFSSFHHGFTNPLKEMQEMVEDVSDTVIPKNAVQKALVPILESTRFNMLLGAVIASNGILFAMQVHCEVVAGLEDKPPEWWAGWDHNMWLADRICIWIFIAEMCLRIIAEQCQFFTGPNKYWNIFEGIIVILSIVEMTSKRAEEAAVFRVLRLVRAVRVIKLFSFMSHLRLMLFSLVSCLYALLWALVLLLMVMFCFATFLENVIQFHAIDRRSLLERRLPSGGTVEESLRENWEGLFLAIRTLSYSIAGGVDWGEVTEPFWEMSWGYGMIYVSFVAIMTFGMLNVMVGVFVQETANVLLLDRELVLDKGVASTKALRDQLTSLFSEMDKNNSMYLSQSELEKSLNEPRIKAFFKHLGIDMATRSDEFFALLDMDCDGKVSLMEFQEVCMQVQGSARPLDVMALSRRIEKYMENLNVRLSRMERVELPTTSQR